MIIDLLHPFTDRFDRAYLVNSQNRDSICLYSSKTKERMTTSYARYLLSNKLGRYLLSTEEADHIDDDPTNDAIDNLQVLNRSDNITKYKSYVGKLRVEYRCPICDKVFSVRRGQSHLVKKDRTSVSCSRQCSGRLSHLDTPDKILMLREYRQH